MVNSEHMNKLILSDTVPLFQNESLRKAFTDMKMSFVYLKMNLWVGHISLLMVSHEHSN